MTETNTTNGNEAGNVQNGQGNAGVDPTLNTVPQVQKTTQPQTPEQIAKPTSQESSTGKTVPQSQGEQKVEQTPTKPKQLQVAPTVTSPQPDTQPAKQGTSDPFARLKKKQVAVPKGEGAQGGQAGVKTKIKKGGRISPKVFLIGCGFFFIFFLGIVFAGLYYAINSSDFLQGIGLKVEDVKSILMIFASLFFGLIFFGGFYVFVFNIYKLITVKARRKIKYILGLILGIFIIIMTIVAGTLSIQQIRGLGGIQKIQTNLLIVPFLDTSDGSVNASTGIPLIAPMRIRYQLNKEIFDRNVLKTIGANNRITGMTVDCGNGQTIAGGPSVYQKGSFFPDYCFYLSKGDYTLKLNVNYEDSQTRKDETAEFTVTNFKVNGEIALQTEGDDAYLNDEKDEYIIGVAPVSIGIKAQLLFTDLSLKNNSILWDLDGDKQVDLQDNANFTYPFGDPKLHTINYQLPELPGYEETWFTFDLRVVESGIAGCSLKVESVDNDKRWKFTPQFDEFIDDELTFNYTIYDSRNDTFIEKNKRESRSFYQHSFDAGGVYEIQVSYYTSDGQKGSCDAETLTVGYVGNNVEFTTKFRQDENTPFIEAGEGTAVQVDHVNAQIAVTLLPAILELTIDDIKPDPTADLKVYYDGRQMFNQSKNLYEINIGKLGEKELKFKLTTSQGREEEQIYTVNVTRQPVKALMKVDPQVGESPLEVMLDASISPLYDENDEIVFFTWDFGDGEIRQNLSQGKMPHTYVYDDDKQNGEFFPKVTIKTKLGFTDTYRLENPILVKKQQKTVTINVDSHPLRQAKISDIVTYSIETDGQIEHIDWDFGNGQSLGCDDRSCATAPVRYSKAGVYDVRVEIQYKDDTPVASRTKIRVY